MRVVIGLGNPGEKYRLTRHNIGFMYLDFLAFKHKFSDFEDKPKLKAQIAEGMIDGQKYLLVKPTTFMNLSGECAVAIKNFYKLDWEDFLICYDDIDLMFGILRFRESGSAGTHNGMRSIIELSGTEVIPRLRFGVNIENRRHDLASFVLSNFVKEELEALYDIFDGYKL
jgi:PTH1 family peptidyl-tRNA hydrolase